MTAPKVFFSYSHDSETHKSWVLSLATRLVANGVDIVLDQWDLALGGDLPRFMESGLTGANRVMAICTDRYVEKANAGHGGVGYEKMILTAQLMRDLSADRIIPVLRNNSRDDPLPVFLGSKRYIDFCDHSVYEARYAELLRDIHGVQIVPRPPLGQNPFKVTPPQNMAPRFSVGSERYVSPALSGIVAFDYSNNNGRYIVGAGDMAFETSWSSGGNNSIHAYSDPPCIRNVALALDVKDIADIADASKYDTSSRARTARLEEIVVWQNSSGYYLATRIESVSARSHGSASDEVVFSYEIAPNKAASFT